jgi:hypothetical protein
MDSLKETPATKPKPPFPGLSDERLEEIARRARSTLAGLVTMRYEPGTMQSVTILSSSLILDMEDLLTLVTEVRRLRRMWEEEMATRPLSPSMQGLTAPDNSE